MERGKCSELRLIGGNVLEAKAPPRGVSSWETRRGKQRRRGRPARRVLPGWYDLAVILLILSAAGISLFCLLSLGQSY